MRFLRLIVFTALILAARSALGHPLLQNAMWVQFEPTRIRVAVNVSVRELAVAHDLAARDDNFDSVALGAAAEKHSAYVAEHLSVIADGRTLTAKVAHVTDPPIVSEPEKTYYQYELDYPLDGPPPARITITQDMLREWPYAVGTPWDVSYLVRYKRSDTNEISTAILPREKPTDFQTGWKTANAPSASQPTQSDTWRTFGDYFRYGVLHILTGWDHLLFISALVIATMNLWEMVKVVAAFTVAHTITLTLSVFDIFRLPSWVVEPMIAASIIFVAVENILWPRRAHSSLRLAVAFGFGLIHGLGFAGGLLEAMGGLPRIGIWVALGAFSLGVEIGHQIVVLPLFGTLAIGRQHYRESFMRPASHYGSMLISLCGAYYLCVALHTQFFAR
jgi:hydrogenase/urease accessory protein HupE